MAVCVWFVVVAFVVIFAAGGLEVGAGGFRQVS